MLARSRSVSLIGLDSHPVDVEVDISYGLPHFTIVGLGAAAIQEAKDRVRSAIKNSQLPFPTHRITVNLAPASLRKDGAQFDLPIAVGLLTANQALPPQPANRLFFGELALNGKTRSTNGVLAISLAAENQGIIELFIPQANQSEASVIDQSRITIYPVESLIQLVAHLKGAELIKPLEPKPIDALLALPAQSEIADFAEINGQFQAKRCLEITAAGGHNLLLIGPPGAGKTLLSRALPGILPPLTAGEALEVTKLYSIAGLLHDQPSIVLQRPFRSPHHTASAVAIIGGGSSPKPGEISLAHCGVLFMDELAEFPQAVIEVLRQPLEDRHIVIARAAGSVRFPADFIFVGAANPCPCGYYKTRQSICSCQPSQVRRYQKRFSGPLLDRIDLHVAVLPVKINDLTAEIAEASASVRARVVTARARQHRRYNGLSILTNNQLRPALLKKLCPLTEDCQDFMQQAYQHYQLSARAYYRMIKIARTIADLEGSDMIKVPHLAEACQYRPQFQHSV